MADHDEIVRLIRLHSTPLGRGVSMDRFEELTGIKRHEWSGKYWPRWNDALAEAGYGPNRFSQAGFEPEVLLKKLADFTLEIGRLPSHADLQFRHTQDAEFPGAHTFHERLGNAASRAERLAQLALSGDEQYQALYEIVAPKLPQSRAKVSTKQATPQSYPGRVYLIRSGDLYKIGKTDTPDRRYMEIQRTVPGKIEEIHILETDDPAGIESYWHRRFSEKRRAGEWFDLSEPDVEAFKRRQGFM